MATAYRIYSNGGTGGPVDYSAPVGTTTGLSFDAGPLGVSTDHTFVARAYDTGTGLEQAGSEALVRVVIGADGGDASGLPNAPHSLALAPSGDGGGRVSWAYAQAAGWGRPTGFQVFLTPGPVVDYQSPAAAVSYRQGQLGYSCLLPGPLTSATYTAVVRSFNEAGAGASLVSGSVSLGPPWPFDMEPVQVAVGSSG